MFTEKTLNYLSSKFYNVTTIGKKSINIPIPYGIRYISDWKEFNILDFNFPHILDKKVPGCGFTEYILRNDYNMILCSPRRILLQNKFDQHGPRVLYFRNTLELEIGFDKSIEVNNRPKYNGSGLSFFANIKRAELEKKREELKEIQFKELFSRLRTEVDVYYNNTVGPKKILVTYDSLGLLSDILKTLGILDNFYIVVDEFQSIFTDSKFKGDVEVEFITHLKKFKSGPCFVSATPMMTEYIEELEEFKNLEMIELDWKTEDPFRVLKPNIVSRSEPRITTKAKEIINTYLSGNFEKTYRNTIKGVEEVESREAVFYLNSVKNLVSIIKNSGLTSSQVNILCASTPQNSSYIKRKLGSSFDIGKVPLKGEPHKMFTFCTRTVYLGADFYSTCARTFIFSDANIETLAVDISLDLPQILGRQRLRENPWANKAEFYYKTSLASLDSSVFDEYIKEKLEKSKEKLELYKTIKNEIKHASLLVDLLKTDIKDKTYKDDYISINKHLGKYPVPVFNNLLLVSERRAFDIQQVDYKDRFTVFNTLYDKGLYGSGTINNVNKVLSTIESKGTIQEKLKCFFEFTELYKKDKEILSFVLDQVPLRFKNFYYNPGPSRCKALGYNTTKINQELLLDKAVFVDDIKKKFLVGERYTRTYIKKELGEIYITHNVSKSPKASDLSEYFEIKSVTIMDPITKEKINGFEIIREK